MKATSGIGRVYSDQAINRDHADCRLGMTLFELLLVLVLLVVVGSLAAPLFEGSFASVRLRRGTDQVLAAWSQTRSHAIESGQIYQFRFKPEGSEYQVEPWTGVPEDDVDQQLREQEIEDAAAAVGATEDEVELQSWREEATLPEEIVFDVAEGLVQVETGQRAVTRLDQDQSTEWSAPILFFPDGTTSDASILLKNNKQLYRRATLRSLTGVARASDVLTRDEVDRYKSR